MKIDGKRERGGTAVAGALILNGKQTGVGVATHFVHLGLVLIAGMATHLRFSSDFA
ncbi:hypothetical protein Hanom_Chr16g01457031 [Helianthus anomalus]